MIVGCESAIPVVDASTPGFSGLRSEDLTDLDRGRRDYIAKCSGCHALVRPAEGDPAYWSRWVTAMAARSKLSADEKERIENYLVTACSIVVGGIPRALRSAREVSLNSFCGTGLATGTHPAASSQVFRDDFTSTSFRGWSEEAPGGWPSAPALDTRAPRKSVDSTIVDQGSFALQQVLQQLPLSLFPQKQVALSSLFGEAFPLGARERKSHGRLPRILDAPFLSVASDSRWRHSVFTSELNCGLPLRIQLELTPEPTFFFVAETLREPCASGPLRVN